MALRPTFKIEGLRELERALGELPKATGKNVLKRTLMKVAKPIEADARRLAPVLRGDLEKHIATSTKLATRQKRAQPKRSTVEVHVGADTRPQAHLQEFGTAHHPPQPFLRPAWDGNRLAALEAIKSDLAMEIEKARARLARKAARKAAK